MKADKSLLQQIVRGLSEGVILIDPDHTLIWANEAALAMHGVERLEDLGRTAADYRKRFKLRYRNKHPLKAGQYPIERVLAGEELHDVVVEVMRPGQEPGHEDHGWIHRVRSLVALDADDELDCLVLIIHDATDRFEAEERFEATFAANPAPAIICRMADRRFVKVNQGFMDMTGFKRETLLEASLADIDVLANAERRDMALERLESGVTIPQMEARISLPGGGEKAVIVAGQPIDMSDEPCMLFTFADLEARTRAESALRQSEERFEKAFRQSPVPQVLMSTDGYRVTGSNDAFQSVFGWSDADACGKSFDELGLWVRPDDARLFEEELNSSGSIRDFECCMQPREGTQLDCLVAADPAMINGQSSLLCVLQDITDRKQSEREITAAIEAAMADASWLTSSIMDKLAAVRRPGPNAPEVSLDALSQRERQVLSLISKGMSDAEIGKKLDLARNTVRNHVAALYRRIGVHSRSEAMIWARERGIGG